MELEKELKTQVQIFGLSFDVRNRNEVKTALDSILSSFKDIDILINNAGNAHGLDPIQTGNVYCASKHAVDAISKGMRIDLNPFGIKVGAINPGLVETEFSKVRFKGAAKADDVYKGFDALQPQDIADIIYFVITRPPHVNIADLLVFPTAQANSVTRLSLAKGLNYSL